MHRNYKYLFVIMILAINFTSCQKKKWTIVEYSSTKIALDSTTEAFADRDYQDYIQPYKEKMSAQMDEVIGQSAQTMRVHKPESLLSNFCADVYREEASDYLKEQADIGIVNLGGIRTDITKGDITIGNIFQLMPFENELVILWLKGDKVKELFDVFAAVGGEGVSGIQMGIKNGKAVNETVGGNPINKDKVYIIATNDFLAGGNDKMVQLAEYEKIEHTGIKIRNMLIDYIREQTKNGNKIYSQLDGRIYEVR